MHARKVTSVCCFSNYPLDFSRETFVLLLTTIFSDFPFACPQCGKLYKYKSSLTNHMKFECGLAPKFHCNYCSYKTFQKGNLKTHVARKHQKLYAFDDTL